MTGLRIAKPDPIEPDFVSQLGWGTKFDGVNCNMAAFGMAADVQTGGRVKPTPVEVRAAQRDQSGGTDLRDGNEALRKLGVPELEIVHAPWEYVRDGNAAGRGVVLQLLENRIHDLGRGFWGSETFEGAHSIFLPPTARTGGGDVASQYLSFNPLYDGRRPGIPRGPRMIPGEVLRAAAYDLGGGKAFAALTRDVVIESTTLPPVRKPQLYARFQNVDGARPLYMAGLGVTSKWVVDLPIGTEIVLGPDGKAAQTTVTRVSAREDGRPYRTFEVLALSSGHVAIPLATKRLLDDGARRTIGLWVPGNVGVRREKSQPHGGVNG